MKIAVIGATGVLGKNLIPILLKNGHKITVLTRSGKKAKELFNDSVSVEEYNLFEDKNDEVLMDILAGTECLIHTAASITQNHFDPVTRGNNVKLHSYGTGKLLNASLKCGVKKYIQQSIAMAYPDYGEEWITEDLPLDVSDFRRVECAPVIETENLITCIPPEKLQWNILRGGRFVGKDTYQKNTVNNIKNGMEIIPGSGMNYLSLVHVKDFAGAIGRIIESDIHGKILNIVDRPIRHKDYIERLAVNLGEGGYIFNRQLPLPPSQKCSNNLAKTLLNWMPEEDIFSVKHLHS